MQWINKLFLTNKYFKPQYFLYKNSVEGNISPACAMSPNMAKQNHLTKNQTTDAINGKEIHCTYVSLLLTTCETKTAVFIEKNGPCFLYTKLPLISASTTLRCMSTPLLFLQREITFVTSYLLSWKMQPFQSRVCSERKEFAPRGANSFL